MLEFLRSTAVRVSECVSVNVQDINWQSGELMVYGQKNRTWRTVCLDDTAKYHLRKYIDSRNDKEPALFISSKRDCKRLAKPGIESAISRIAERSGLKRRVYPHLFRKTTATNMVKRGCPREVLVAGTTPEELRKLFTDPIKTAKMTVTERGQVLGEYENYTEFYRTEEYTGKIYGIVVNKVGESVEERLASAEQTIEQTNTDMQMAIAELTMLIASMQGGGAGV